MVARKTSETPTRIWSFGALAPTSGAAEAHDALFLGNRYANKLIEVERNRYAAYQAVRRQHAPALCALEDAFAEAEETIETVLENIHTERADIFRATKKKTKETSPELKTKLKAAKDHRKDVANRMKAARGEFEATLKPAREELKKRLSDGKKGVEGSHSKERINTETVAKMLLEEWPEPWKALQRVDDAALAAKKRARDTREVGAGTGDLVEAAVEQAIKDAGKPTRSDGTPKRSGPPRFRAFRGEGRLGVRSRTGGWTVAELFGGAAPVRLRRVAPTARLDGPSAAPPGFRWSRSGKTLQRCHANAGAGATLPTEAESHLFAIRLGKTIWAEFPVRIHRPLPEDAIVKCAWVLARKKGPRTVYELQLTLESKSFLTSNKRPMGAGRVAVNFGWRQIRKDPTEIRIAYWVSDNGEQGEIKVSEWTGLHDDRAEVSESENLRRKLATSIEHADGIGASADKYYAQILKHVIACSPDSRFTHFEWMASDRNREVFVRWVHGFCQVQLGDGFGILWKEWSEERSQKKEDLFASVEVAEEWAKAKGLMGIDALAFWLGLWCRKDKHLRQYEADARRRALNQRDAFFRCEAILLATRFGELVTDDAKFSTLVERADEEKPDATEPHAKARQNRHALAPGRFREVLREVFGQRRELRVPAKDNSKRCSTCAAKIEPTIGETIVTCATCGDLDTDANNCRNMLREAGPREERDLREVPDESKVDHAAE